METIETSGYVATPGISGSSGLERRLANAVEIGPCRFVAARCPSGNCSAVEVPAGHAAVYSHCYAQPSYPRYVILPLGEALDLVEGRIRDLTPVQYPTAVLREELVAGAARLRSLV